MKDVETTTAIGAGAEHHPAAERMRLRFEAKYGDLSECMRSILHWRSKWDDFERPFNRDLENPVREDDVDVAEGKMLSAIRAYAEAHKATTEGQLP